jgi:murein DD-endopeptidase MepM/ murein hydrolase activator NlpD
MITKNKTRKFKGLLYLMFLPLLALCILAFSTDQPQKKLIEIPEIEYGILYNFSDNIENPPTLLPIRQENLTRVSSYFGMRINPVRKIKQLHTGIDYMAALGADILASASGTITKVSDKRKGFGKMIVIKHCNTYETRYAHMDGFAVKEGDKVKKGQVIGYVGNTGMSLGPHLHFEVRKNGKPVNPKDYLKEEL